MKYLHTTAIFSNFEDYKQTKINKILHYETTRH